jgi:hypothetical protein
MNGSFNPDELAILQEALDQACHELNLSAANTDERDWLARMMLNFGRYGDMRIDEMKSYAILRYHRRKPHVPIYSRPISSPANEPT